MCDPMDTCGFVLFREEEEFSKVNKMILKSFNIFLRKESLLFLTFERLEIYFWDDLTFSRHRYNRTCKNPIESRVWPISRLESAANRRNSRSVDSQSIFVAVVSIGHIELSRTEDFSSGTLSTAKTASGTSWVLTAPMKLTLQIFQCDALFGINTIRNLICNNNN